MKGLGGWSYNIVIEFIFLLLSPLSFQGVDFFSFVFFFSEVGGDDAKWTLCTCGRAIGYQRALLLQGGEGKKLSRWFIQDSGGEEEKKNERMKFKGKTSEKRCKEATKNHFSDRTTKGSVQNKYAIIGQLIPF